ncbi:reverse transcriptase zinc-binding domain-containing protein, partial [Tanacetum coccineum]
GYGKEITVGSAIILANVSVFSPNPSMHYLNITKKNVVKVFHKDFVPGNGSGVGGSGMLMEEEEIVKLVEEEEMADLELHVCGNVIDQEDLYKFDEEALDLVLEEEARESRAHEEWLEKCRQQEEEDAKHERQLLGGHGGGALGANKARTHPVIAIFVYPLRAVGSFGSCESGGSGSSGSCESGGSGTGGGALGALGANKASTHHVIAIFLYPLGAVEAACALEVDAMGALDLVEV